MAVPARTLRPRPVEAEKITVNLGHVDLGHVDLLVQEGFYTNRTDFIRTAIRNQIDRHAEAASRAVRREGIELGLRHVTRAELERLAAGGQRLDLHVLGLVSIADDVPVDLALSTIASIRVLGALHASPALKAALADRID